MRPATLALVSLVLLAGCLDVAQMSFNAPSPRAPDTEDREAKRFLPDQEGGSIYIFRDRISRHQHAVNVYLNGKLIGYVGAYTYVAFNVPPGRYEIAAGQVEPHLAVEVGRGELVFVWVAVNDRPVDAYDLKSPDFRVSRVSEDRGKFGVMHSDRLRHEYHVISGAKPMAVR